MHQLRPVLHSFGIAWFAGSAVAQPQPLEEIVVTATKQETRLLETPLAVSVFSGDELTLRRIDISSELQYRVPNLLVSRGSAFDNVVIRGIGYTAQDGTASPGTAVHFNGVYLQGRQILDAELFDIERVEILRGPQGTLYGRNATGGVVNIISRGPGEDLTGDVSLQLGNYDTRRATAAIDLPLTSNLQQRFAGFYLKRDGFTDNQYTGNEIDGRDMYGLRSTTRFSPGPDSEINLVIDYMDEDSDRLLIGRTLCSKDPEGVLGCLPNGLRSEAPHSGATLNGFLLNLLPPFDWPQDDFANSVNPAGLRDVISDFEPVYEAEELLLSLEWQQDFGAWQFTSLTGYREVDRDIAYDFDMVVASEPWPVSVTVPLGPNGDFLANSSFSVGRETTDSEQWIQEFRLASSFAGPVNWLLGANWLDHEQHSVDHVYTSTLSYAAEIFGLDTGNTLISDFDPFEIESWAVFGEMYLSVNSRTRLTLGLRYTDEEKELTERFLFLNFTDETTQLQDNWDALTGKLALDYHHRDDLLLYGSLSRSHKAAGFNLSGPSYDPEYINALELGIKSELPDQRGLAAVTGFYYDYEDMQFSRVQNVAQFTENTDAEVYGLEAELMWRPAAHWRIDAHLAWLETEMSGAESVDLTDPNQMGTTEGITSIAGQNFLADGSLGLPVDLSGKSLPYAPQFSARLALSYRHRVQNFWLTWMLDYYWQDDFEARVYNARNDAIDSWDVLDAVAVLEADTNWSLQLYVKNVFDDDFVTGHLVSDPIGGLGRWISILEPRTYGVRLGFGF